MYAWVDVYGYMERHMDVWMSGRINGCIDGWIYVCLDRLVTRLVSAWLPGRRDG